MPVMAGPTVGVQFGLGACQELEALKGDSEIKSGMKKNTFIFSNYNGLGRLSSLSSVRNLNGDCSHSDMMSVLTDLRLVSPPSRLGLGVHLEPVEMEFTRYIPGIYRV